MTIAVVTPPQVRKVTDWIEQQARALSIPVTVYPNGIQANGDWINVPVAVGLEVGDAYDRAIVLQQIEEVWNDSPLIPGVNLLLIPAKHNEATIQERYEKVGELMERQRQLLDRMGQEGMTAEEVQRFQAIRHEWEETLDEMTRLFPALAAGVF